MEYFFSSGGVIFLRPLTSMLRTFDDDDNYVAVFGDAVVVLLWVVFCLVGGHGTYAYIITSELRCYSGGIFASTCVFECRFGVSLARQLGDCSRHVASVSDRSVSDRSARPILP